MERKSAWNRYSEEDRAALEALAADYRSFLDAGKTERECVAESVRLAQAAGFADMRTVREARPGDRLYLNWMNKSLVLFVLGEAPLSAGMNILGAHIDSPRLDVKPNPLYESDGLAYLDTHYYGGIKKYQWVVRPLAIHGVIVRKDGSTLQLRLGEEASDPVFCITDLLPHLSQEQMKKDGMKVVEGEDLDLLIGNRPLQGAEKDAVAANVVKFLESRGLAEEDFASAELELVPAGGAREMGVDRSMILGYGQDDRVCAYPSLRALLDFTDTPQRTLAVVLTDKEEIGSVGATGMNSQYFEDTVAELLELRGEYTELNLRRCLRSGRMLSSDVAAAYDPLYAGAFEKKNAALLGYGLCFNKYTGSRGKSGANDANAEFVAEVRRIMDDAGVSCQFSEIGRVDMGGGGTISFCCAKYGMNVIDACVPVLSMHAPIEVSSKADLYEAYRGYCAFLRSC